MLIVWMRCGWLWLRADCVSNHLEAKSLASDQMQMGNVKSLGPATCQSSQSAVDVHSRLFHRIILHYSKCRDLYLPRFSAFLFGSFCALPGLRMSWAKRKRVHHTSGRPRGSCHRAWNSEAKPFVTSEVDEYDEWMMTEWWMNDEWVPMCRVERLKGAWGTHSWACLGMSVFGHGVKAFPARHVVRSAQTPKATHSTIAQGCTAAHFVLPKCSAIMSLDSVEASTHAHTHTHSHALTCTGQTEIWAWNPVWGWQHVAAITAITAITTLAFWNDACVTCTACAALTRDGWLSWMPFRMRFRMPFRSVIGHTMALVSVSFGQRGLAEVIWSNGWPVERMDRHLHVRVWALRAFEPLSLTLLKPQIGLSQLSHGLSNLNLLICMMILLWYYFDTIAV